MKLLLDTHALLWWLADDSKLPRPTYAAIHDETNDVLVSAVSAYEICLKSRLGKLPGVEHLTHDLEKIVAEQGFSTLPLTVQHAVAGGSLPVHHKDPFDRLLIAQALIEGLTLVSNERAFDRFGVQRLW